MAVKFIGDGHGYECSRDACSQEARYQEFEPDYDQLGMMRAEAHGDLLCEKHLRQQTPRMSPDGMDCGALGCGPEFCDYPHCKTARAGHVAPRKVRVIRNVRLLDVGFGGGIRFSGVSAGAAAVAMGQVFAAAAAADREETRRRMLEHDPGPAWTGDFTSPEDVSLRGPERGE